MSEASAALDLADRKREADHPHSLVVRFSPNNPLRLDAGVLYSKYYGETERNLHKALDTVEIMAPCVLWMDEIEKGVAAGDDDDGMA